MRKGVIMRKISRFALWICSKFTKTEIEFLVKELINILKHRNPDVKPKDDFKEKYPHYRKFSVDPKPPEPAKKKSFWITRFFLKPMKKNTAIL